MINYMKVKYILSNTIFTFQGYFMCNGIRYQSSLNDLEPRIEWLRNFARTVYLYIMPPLSREPKVSCGIEE